MTSEERRQQESEYYWFGPEAQQATLESWIPSEEDPSILEGEGQTPEPVELDLETQADASTENPQEL